ncbi:MAG: beta-glucosidase H, partial [Acidimicrobiia bacterium]
DVPGMRVTDGPNGARGPRWTGQGALCVPCGSGLGATWDPALLERVGRALGEEARTKGAHVLLAPTVNLHRHPLAGRNFECYSEDPYLTARLAVGFVRGVQSNDVGVTVKHFVANDSEFERMSISSEVDERTLRELYLVPFEAAVKDAGAWGVMSAYNRVNGTFCSEHPWLLTTVLRDEWGFDGFVISDWFGTHSTAPAANAGLDLEMPGPAQWYGKQLAAAVNAGEVPEATLDARARNVLEAGVRTGALAGIGNDEARSVDLPAHRALAREAAAASFVLLRNEGGVLPLDASALGSVALIGSAADQAWIMGGGSASLTPHYSVTPLEGLEAALGSSTELHLARGPATNRTIPLIDGRRLHPSASGELPITLEYFATTDFSGPVVMHETLPTTRQIWMGHWTDVFDGSRYSARATATLEVEEDGEWAFGLTTVGPCRVMLDGEVVVDAWTDRPGGESFFGFGSKEIRVTVPLRTGAARALQIDYSSEGTSILGGFALGASPPERADALDQAVATARDADVAIVVVGTGPDWESEGNDRQSMDLPRDQAALIRVVAAANPRTIVCVNAGAPVTMDWSDAVPAVLQCWLPGQEWGNALADVLLGRAEPGGRLPTTFPERLEDSPGFPDYPGADGQVAYSEGVFMGYRGYDTHGYDPTFCFGHGLGYTTFTFGDAHVDGTTVSIDITNTGSRAGSDVVQCYVGDVESSVSRPVQDLRAFEKVTLEPGASRTVTFALGDRAFAFWSDTGWVVEPGAFTIRIGASSRDIRAEATIEHPGATLPV